jgi:tetratricopeptide (TPR) repeat protein
MQIRHVWHLWPVTLLAPFLSLKGSTILKRVNRERIFFIVFSGLAVLLLFSNLLVIRTFVRMFAPTGAAKHYDANYFTFSSCYAQNPYKAWAYLDPTGAADVAAYRRYARAQNWKDALFHARLALRKGAEEAESRLMCVEALTALGQAQEALDILQDTGDDSAKAKLLEINLLIDLKRFHDAANTIRHAMQFAPQDMSAQLEAMLHEAERNQRSDQIMTDKK